MGGVPVMVGASYLIGLWPKASYMYLIRAGGPLQRGPQVPWQEVGAHNPDTAACSHLPDSSLWSWMLGSWPLWWLQNGCRLLWGLLTRAQYWVCHPFLPGVLLTYKWFLSLLCSVPAVAPTYS